MSQAEEKKGFTVRDRRFSVDSGNGQGDGQAGEAQQYPTYVEQLRAELDEKSRQLREYIAAYKEQVVQGIEDSKQRLQRENERELERMRGRMVEELLEVLDNLDRSLASAAEQHNFDALVTGIGLVRDQFTAKLGSLGLSRFDATGERFDPAAHEAVGLVPVGDPSQDGVVVAQVKSGYRLGDRVLRPALVQVGKLAS